MTMTQPLRTTQPSETAQTAGFCDSELLNSTTSQKMLVLPRKCLSPIEVSPVQNFSSFPHHQNNLEQKQNEQRRCLNAIRSSVSCTSSNALLEGSASRLLADDQAVQLRTFSRGIFRRRFTQHQVSRPNFIEHTNAILPKVLSPQCCESPVLQTHKERQGAISPAYLPRTEPSIQTEPRAMHQSTLPKVLQMLTQQSVRVESGVETLKHNQSSLSFRSTSSDLNWQPDSTPVEFNKLPTKFSQQESATVKISSYLEQQKWRNAQMREESPKPLQNGSGDYIYVHNAALTSPNRMREHSQDRPQLFQRERKEIKSDFHVSKPNALTQSGNLEKVSNDLLKMFQQKKEKFKKAKQGYLESVRVSEMQMADIGSKYESFKSRPQVGTGRRPRQISNTDMIRRSLNQLAILSSKQEGGREEFSPSPIQSPPNRGAKKLGGEESPKRTTNRRTLMQGAAKKGPISMTPNRKRLVNFLLTDSNQTKTPSGKSTSTAAGNRSWQKEQTRRIMIYNHANLDSQQKGGYPAALKLSKNQKSLIKNYNNAQGSAVEADRTLAFRSTGVSLFGKP